ncbi:hypothetical protein ACWGKW_00245 [Streptomyces sp. NPDC054766]
MPATRAPFGPGPGTLITADPGALIAAGLRTALTVGLKTLIAVIAALSAGVHVHPGLTSPATSGPASP